MRTPVAPTGWPSEMPEPLTLRRSKSPCSNSKPAVHGQHLRGKGLVEFDQVDVVERQAGALQRQLDGGHRADAHALGLDAGDRPGDQARQRLQTERCRLLAAS